MFTDILFQHKHCICVEILTKKGREYVFKDYINSEAAVSRWGAESCIRRGYLHLRLFCSDSSQIFTQYS